MGDDTSRRQTRHRLWRALSVTLAVILVVAAGVGAWTVTSSFPQTFGTLDIPGLHKPVTVYRDSAGIPQVTASTADDLFRAQGFVHAQDRFWEMDFRRHVTSGRLSEMFGESQAPADTFIRTLGWRRVAEQEVSLLSPTALRYYRDYAAGVNAYLDARSGSRLSLEYAILGLQNPGYRPEKWTPADSVAWLKAMAWDLRSNLGEEVDRALLATTLTPQQIAELHPGYDYAAHPTITDLGGGDPARTTPNAPEPLKASEPPGAPTADAGGSSEAGSGDVDTSWTHSALTAAPPAAYEAQLQRVAARVNALPKLMGPAGSDIGSNSWVLSGALTATGSPLLSNDPHLGASLPSVWYQMGLRCTTATPECPFDVSGFGFSGFPGVVIGHNARIAWGFTNFGPDVADLYVEKVNGDTYEYDGVQVPLDLRRETIRVAGGADIEITVRSTRHGPIVTDLSHDYATIVKNQASTLDAPTEEFQLSLQWTALTPGPTASAIFAFDTASDWAGFRAAAADFHVPSQNLVYADIDGHIGYQAPGRVPIRAAGDGTVPVPGWTSHYGWVGTVPDDQLPSVFDPPSGYIITANNAAVGPRYPAMITKDWEYGYRANRIAVRLQNLVASGTKATIEHVTAIQGDTYNAKAATLTPLIEAATATASHGTGAARGAALLARWDHHDDADSAAAAYFNVFWKNLLHNAFGRKLPSSAPPTSGDRWFAVAQHLASQPDSPWWADSGLGVSTRDEMFIRSAEDAWKEARALMGNDPATWRWDRIHTLALTNSSLGISGVAPVEWLLNRGPYPVSGGSSVVEANGWDASRGYQTDRVPSMRMVIDLARFDRSRWITLTGASGHAFDPHYTDQTTLWARNETLPWAFSPTAVAAAATHTLVLRPARPRT